MIVNIMRGGSGLGNIAPSQSDYWQATRGGGHGDYRTLVLAAWSVQELYDLTREAFELADRYRNPVLVLGDAVLGQMMEPVVLPREVVDPAALPPKPWATSGAQGRPRNIVNSLYIEAPELEKVNLRMHAQYEKMRQEVRFETERIEDAEIVVGGLRHGGAGGLYGDAAGESGGAGGGAVPPDHPLPLPQRGPAPTWLAGCGGCW